MKYIFLLLIAVFIFTSCSDDTAVEVTETTAESVTETTTVNPYILVRGWSGEELLNSIYFCGENRSLPFSLNEVPDFSWSYGVLTLPDGSSVSASCNENREIISIHAKAESAPLDFSIYGIDFFAKPDDIYEKVGIADEVTGDKKSEMKFRFYQGGIHELTFIFNEEKLTDIYIAS